jgi:type II secretory pathway pseudopilin PulG
MSPGRRGRVAGFTLIELMLSAAAERTPSFTALPPARARSTRPRTAPSSRGTRLTWPRIELPTPTSLATLSGYAALGNMTVTGGAVGATVYNPQTRIEFIPVDINGDGDFTNENEGFIRVYRANNTTAGALNYVTARRWNTASATDPNASSPNCGDLSRGVFMTAAEHTNTTAAPHRHSTASTLANQRLTLNAATRRCYLGGDPPRPDATSRTDTTRSTRFGSAWRAGSRRISSPVRVPEQRKVWRTEVIQIAVVARRHGAAPTRNLLRHLDFYSLPRAAPFMLNAPVMSLRPISRQRSRLGFTMIEMALVLLIIAIMTGMMIPSLQRNMLSHQTRRAAATVAGDLERAFTLAARYRRPMRLSCVVAAGVCANATYTIADRTGGTVRVRRRLQNDGDLGTMSVRLANPQVDIFPSGVSTAADTVTITAGNSTRRVTMTTAGQVRILP